MGFGAPCGAPAQHRASGTIIWLGLHRSFLHGPLIWQTTTSKLIRAHLEGAVLGMERCRLVSLPSQPSRAQPSSPGSLFSPQENQASKRFTSKQLSTLFLSCVECWGLGKSSPCGPWVLLGPKLPSAAPGLGWQLLSAPDAQIQISPEDPSALGHVGYSPHPSALASSGAQWLCGVLGTPWGCQASPGRDWALHWDAGYGLGEIWALHWDAGHHLGGSCTAGHLMVLPGTAQWH